MELKTALTYLKGIGPNRAALLKKELGAETVGDLLEHYPASFLDRSQVYKIADLHGAEMPQIQLRGRFIAASLQGEGARTRLVTAFTDGTGVIEVVWFRQAASIQKSLNPDVTYVLFGKPTEFNRRWQLVHPELDTEASAEKHRGLRGVYPLTEGLRNRGITSRQLHTWMVTALDSNPPIPETLPEQIVRANGLMSRAEALRAIHRPANMIEAQRARHRLKFEELFYLQLNIIRYGRNRKAALKGHVFSKIGHYFNSFYERCMPFELTGAQKRVIREIRSDMNTGRQMNRLLQGDVGSGKTLVALLTMLIAIDNGTQACLMAPTEILATQHYESISAMAGELGLNIKLLTGSTPKSRRDEIHSQLTDGSLNILIGTHAVIEDNVRFARLGYVVIDEQHRFGVAQRARLWQKAEIAPHVLVMTATPIPRTLAMTVYGDLDVSIIDELPPGRKPVTTVLRYDVNRQQIYNALHRQLLAGRQAYIVYPLIDENPKLELRDLQTGYDNIAHLFSDFKVAMVHGRMKPSEKERQMQLFASGEAKILVATTVIEVGVNVPNASVMIIENAERFGLSQLHQLRGRVGRGADQSYCILMSRQNLSHDSRHRLQVMTATTDGFILAEEDMKLRGPGDIEGTAQSGLHINLKIASLVADTPILQQARTAAEQLLDADPQLASYPGLRLTLSRLFDRTMDWARIS